MGCSCHQTAGFCQCLLTDTQCVRTIGGGSSDDPYEAELILDPSSLNDLEITPAGIRALMPVEISNPASAGIKRTTELDVSDFTTTQIPFDLEVWDVEALHSSDFETRMEIPRTGTYVVTGHVRWKRVNDSYRLLVIMRNGGAFLAASQIHSPSSNNNSLMQTVSTIQALGTGEFLELAVAHNVGSKVGLEINNEFYTAGMAGCRVGNRL